MKVKLSELKPNPYKKNISGGKLDDDTVKKIQSNIKELGLMGALPVFKRDNKYFLIAGHHRTEALKREFGKDYPVSVEVHNYNDDQILRGMIVENLTQRANEFREEAENLKMIRNHIKANSLGELARDKFHQGGRYESCVKEVAEWLNKNGEVMSRSKISQILKIIDTVDPDILERIEKVGGGKAPENVVTTKQAIELSKIEDKNEQRHLLEAMRREESGRPHELGHKYRDAPEEVKKMVREGEIDLSDIDMATETYNLQQKRQGKVKAEKTDSEKIDEFLGYLRMTSSDIDRDVKQSIKYLFILSKYTDTMNSKQKGRLNSELKMLRSFFGKAEDLITKILGKI